MQKDYKDLVEFWDNSFKMTSSQKEELSTINENDYKDLAPSIVLFDSLNAFNNKEEVLDYGCGNGWASIIMAKLGTKSVKAVDVSHNSIKLVNTLKNIYNVGNIIKEETIDDSWLKKQKDETYDGFFSSNVIDVIPFAFAKEIIKESARITKKDATIIFSLNYYIDPEKMKDRGYKTKGSHIYIDGILRLNALTDEEWTKIFKEYYKDIKLSYFSWPGEETPRRRLFILKK